MAGLYTSIPKNCSCGLDLASSNKCLALPNPISRLRFPFGVCRNSCSCNGLSKNPLTRFSLEEALAERLWDTTQSVSCIRILSASFAIAIGEGMLLFKHLYKTLFFLESSTIKNSCFL